jgi:hypothetical protein
MKDTHILNKTIDKVDEKIEKMTHHSKDTHSYKGWLNSDSFLKRSFSILGYSTVASLIIVIPFYIILFTGIMIAFFAFGGDDMGHKGMRYDKEFSGQYREMNRNSEPETEVPEYDLSAESEYEGEDLEEATTTKK